MKVMLKQYLLLHVVFCAAFLGAAQIQGSKKEELSKKTCTACQGSVPILDPKEEKRLLDQVPAWGKDAYFPNRITRRFSFDSYQESIAFINRVANVAEREGHHPDIFVFGNQVRLDLYTHAVNGLTESDFIMAAKIDIIPLANLAQKDNSEQGQTFRPLHAVVTEYDKKRLFTGIGDWKEVDALSPRLSRRFEFTNFVQTMSFVNEIAKQAQAMSHYPDLYIFYSRARIDIYSPGLKTFSFQDFELAQYIDDLFDQHLTSVKFAFKSDQDDEAAGSVVQYTDIIEECEALAAAS
ncbi:MAG: 4a-hydroxytetrahydrobiopterin dehydratase [Epsilonproteobacteria bacterium]|nr:4a-hydroxytetrahydrobiopterin dehydratase [Campylobacterota bacterium]